jgi:hypothetical protein
MNKQQLEHDLHALTESQTRLQQQRAALKQYRPKEKVLAAIAQQRYFYFKEKSSVIFDRESGYLWAEEWLAVTDNIKTVELTGKNLGNPEEVECLLKELKTIYFLGFTDWDIPTPYDFRIILKDKNSYLPNFIYKDDQTSWVYKGYARDKNLNTLLNLSNKLLVLNDWGNCSANYSANEKDNISKNLTPDSVAHKIIIKNEIQHNCFVENRCAGNLNNLQFFLVNKSIAIPFPELDSNFDKCSIDEQNKITAQRAKQCAENTLQTFLQENLIPIFNEAKIAPLYDSLKDIAKITVDLEAIEKQISHLLTIKAQQAELLSSQFNYRALLVFKNFDCASIDTSLIRFADATIDWCSLLEDKVAEYQIRQHKLITEGNSLTVELAKPYKVASHLSHAENTLLQARQIFMFERLSLNMNIPMANLASMKLQCHQLKKRLFELNSDANGLMKLGQLASEPRPSFELVAENSATMLVDVLKKMEFYEANRDLINTLIRIEQDWCKDYKAFKVNAPQHLAATCIENSIEQDIGRVWLQDWSEKRWLIEQCIQPLLEKGLAGAFTQHRLQTTMPLVLQLIEALTLYKQKIDDFYQHDRKSLYQKFAFEANGALQEKFEAENELYKQTLVFQQTLQDIVFALEKVEERLWLLQWGDVLLDMTITVILEFIHDNALDNISKAIIHDFSQLKLQNYATFINDAKASAEMMNQWDKDYNSLMFKMRKELNNNRIEKAVDNELVG